MNSMVKQFEKEYRLFVLQKLHKLMENAHADTLGNAVKFFCENLCFRKTAFAGLQQFASKSTRGLLSLLVHIL